MTKEDIFNYFDQKISKVCFIPEDEPGNYMLVGKFCIIQEHSENIWDILICNQKNMKKGLGTGKVRNIASVLVETAVKDTYREMNGEASMLVQGNETILNNLKILGIRRKRIVSEEQKEKMKKTFNKWKENK